MDYEGFLHSSTQVHGLWRIFLQHPDAMDSEGIFFRNHVQWTMKDFFMEKCLVS
jgi:hypothetical protein